MTMNQNTNFDLAPRLIAKPLDTINTWRLPDVGDLAALHRGVLQTLGAMDALSQLDVPLAVHALGAVREPGYMECEQVRGLIDQAEQALNGVAHCVRIQQVRDQSPGHAMQLERTRRQALDKIRSLRTRIDFIRGMHGDEPARQVSPEGAPAGSLLH